MRTAAALTISVTVGALITLSWFEFSDRNWKEGLWVGLLALANVGVLFLVVMGKL